MNENDIRSDFTKLSTLEPPVRRAAYSGRTPWLMAIMSELAYTRFDEEDTCSLTALATELAEITDRDVIADKLQSLGKTIGKRDGNDNETLRSVLAVGGFELRGVLFNSSTDTQGFVATRSGDSGPGLAVASFRGTESLCDWKTNIDLKAAPVTSRKSDSPRILGKVHAGFNEAFLSVEAQIDRVLDGCEHLPLYLTGHSLGGALATLATWHLAGDRLAACYTFGAPRVGDNQLLNRFRTPIFRIVNGADPVPLVPPCSYTISILKSIIRGVGLFIPVAGKLNKFLIGLQGFRHYGYQRHLSICEAGEDGSFPKLKNEFGIGGFERLASYVGRLWRGELRLRRGSTSITISSCITPSCAHSRSIGNSRLRDGWHPNPFHRHSP